MSGEKSNEYRKDSMPESQISDEEDQINKTLDENQQGFQPLQISSGRILRHENYQLQISQFSGRWAFFKKSWAHMKIYWENTVNQNKYLPLKKVDEKKLNKYILKAIWISCIIRILCIDGYYVYKKYLLAPTLMLLANYIFESKMIKGCGEIDRVEICIEQVIVKNFETILKQTFLVATLTYYLLYLIYKKVVSRYFLIPFVLGVLYKCIFQHDLAVGSQKLDYFGGAIIYFIILANIGIFLIHMILRCFYKMFKKSKLRFFLVIAAIFVSYFIVLEELKTTCENWDNGIAGYIEKGDDNCNLLEPYICWHNAIDGWFFFDSSCKIKNLKESKQNLLKLFRKIDPVTQNQQQINQIADKYNYMAYPFTNQFTKEQKNEDYPTQQTMIDQSIFTSSYQEVKDSGREVIVNLNTMEMEFQMKRDEELASIRREVYDEKKHIAKNVILIYIDTLSRPQAHRKLPKTMEFLSQFSEYDAETRSFIKQADEKAKIYEFFRFHSIDKKTRNNNMKLQYNYTRAQLDEFPLFEEKKPNLIQEFKKRGYITAHSTNTCTSLCNFRNTYQPYKEYFYEDYGDHEFLMYDPQYIDPENYYNLQQGINSILRRCVYNKDTSDHVFRYGQKFLETYKDDPKYLFLEFTDAHEMTSEIVTYLDDLLLDFFINIQKLGYFDKETNIMLVSDHGQHIVTQFVINYENTDMNPTNSFYQIERLLPLFMSIMTKDILQEYPDIDDNMMENQQKLISMQQIRNTLVTNAEGYDNMVYFQDSIYAEREKNLLCPDLPFAQVDPIRWCVCKNPDLEEAAAFIEEYKYKKKIEKELKKLEKKQQKLLEQMDQLMLNPE